jgi:hypothetical protein
VLVIKVRLSNSTSKYTSTQYCSLVFFLLLLCVRTLNLTLFVALMTDDVKLGDSDYDDIENTPVGVPVPVSNPAYNPNAPGAYNVFSIISESGSTCSERTTQFIDCPYCHNECRTRTRTFPSCLTYTAAVLIGLVFWPLCWMPFVCDCYYQTDHFCSVCGNKVGSVDPYDDCCVTYD